MHRGGGRGYNNNRRDDDRYHDRRGRRPRSRSPAGHRGGGRSRNNRSPDREGSVERRAKIEQWNREREEAQFTGKNDESKNENTNTFYDSNDFDQQNLPPQQQQQQHDDDGYDY